MYKFIRAILDKSRDAKVDIGVANAMLIYGMNEEESAPYRNAFANLQKYYVAFTTFNREGREELIQELCTLLDNHDAEGVTKFLKLHDDFIQQSLTAASQM